MEYPISHALVLPDDNFADWYSAIEPYTKTFERVAVIRSPRGNDLNRFRDVTAVQAPRVWVDNDPLGHIRRTYPLVVRVDVIAANSPAELAQALQKRIVAADRFGEKSNQDNHIHDRFVLAWPSDGFPARITRRFDDHTGGAPANEGLDILSGQGTAIRAAASGVVATIVREPTAIGYGQYVQIGTRFNNENYLITYAHLQNITVRLGQVITAGDIIGEGATDNIKLVVQKPGNGKSGYILPDILDPTLMIYWQALKLRTTANGLRIRERAGKEYRVIGQLYIQDRFETLEPHGYTLQKIGVEGQWVKVRSPQNIEGFSAAEYLTAGDYTEIRAANVTGINLDLQHPLGKPDPIRLKGTGWVRFAYNVSMGRGSTDLNAAYDLHAPYIERYAKAGLKVILVLTHQTYGEGAGYVWPNMNSDRWYELAGRFSDFAGKIADRFTGKDLIAAYQIWNEQDTPPQVASAAVSIPAADYGSLLARAIRAIGSTDPKTRIITGGHVGGPGNGVNYAKATLAAMPPDARPDGIAVHSYGRGPLGSKYSPFGSIDEDIIAYGKVIPQAPVWITEWGVLDHPNDPVEDVTEYATGFVDRIKRLYLGKVSCAIWYAWADTMHNGYGLVNKNDQPKQPLYNDFLKV
ncbi:MAG: M23 family metallopeptidase [Anaerolineaceae bacterium]|nr:M23 family metallopeptidase [Anaerolineaceae bacterium]